MKHRMIFLPVLIALLAGEALSQGDSVSSPNTRQYYSGKFGFYDPGGGLNNGLVLGIDGITEFLRYNFFLTAAADLYPKQSISIFSDPQPNGGSPPGVSDQQILLIPLHLNFGYKVFDAAGADTRGYLGVGGGYYLYFYSATVTSGSGGILGGGLTSTSDSKNGGAVFGSLFARVLISKVFVEPRMFFASKSEDALGGYSFAVDPSGFSITLGFQYH